MKYEISLGQREEIKAKMAEVLNESIKCLSAEFQEILLDDLVTAFQNRMNVLVRVNEKMGSNGD